MTQSMTTKMAELAATHDRDELARRAQYELDRCQVQLLSGSPFFAVLLMRLKKEVMKHDPNFTMGVDGKHLFWGPAFVLSLTARELRFVLCHEVLHCSLGHHTRRQGRDPKRWNIACDHAINLLLKDMSGQGWEMPSDGFADPQFANLPAEVIYERLEAPLPPGAGGGAGSSPPPTDSAPSQRVDGPASAAEHGFGGCGELMDAPANDAQASERVWQQHTNVALNAAEKAGHAPGNLARLLRDRAKPQIPWQGVLRRYLTERAAEDYRFVPPNRRYVHRGIYLPSRRSEKLGTIALVWDLSGSVTPDLMAHYLSETEALIRGCQPSELVLMSCDTHVQDCLHFKPHQKWQLPERMRGGGGTRFDPPFARLDEMGVRPKVLLYFTDLESSRFPVKPGYDVFWCVPDKCRHTPPFGKVLTMAQAGAVV